MTVAEHMTARWWRSGCHSVNECSARTVKSLNTATLAAGSCPASSGRMVAVSFACSAAIVSWSAPPKVDPQLRS